MTRRPRQITRRIEDFPHIIREPNSMLFGDPILDFKDDDNDPVGYREWKRLYKKRRKAGG